MLTNKLVRLECCTIVVLKLCGQHSELLQRKLKQSRLSIPFLPLLHQLKSMARDLLEASRTSRPKSMLGVYEALKAIESYPKAPLPIKLVPSSPSVEELSSGDVALLVRSKLEIWVA